MKKQLGKDEEMGHGGRSKSEEVEKGEEEEEEEERKTKCYRANEGQESFTLQKLIVQIYSEKEEENKLEFVLLNVIAAFCTLLLSYRHLFSTVASGYSTNEKHVIRHFYCINPKYDSQFC